MSKQFVVFLNIGTKFLLIVIFWNEPNYSKTSFKCANATINKIYFMKYLKESKLGFLLLISYICYPI